jgi:hypothetical protein
MEAFTFKYITAFPAMGKVAAGRKRLFVDHAVIPDAR